MDKEDATEEELPAEDSPLPTDTKSEQDRWIWAPLPDFDMTRGY